MRVKRTNTSPSLVAMTTTQIPIIARERRYITARECARLQSMRELQHLPKGIAAMEALGNAVNVRVVEAIMEKLRALLPVNHGDNYRVPSAIAIRRATRPASSSSCSQNRKTVQPRGPCLPLNAQALLPYST